MKKKKSFGLKAGDAKIIIKREQYVCAECGGLNVEKDAWAVWNVKEQKWELEDVYDQAYCKDCDGETKLAAVELNQIP
jgi:ribosomal protein L37AE/L43A